MIGTTRGTRRRRWSERGRRQRGGGGVGGGAVAFSIKLTGVNLFPCYLLACRRWDAFIRDEKSHFLVLMETSD